MLSGFFYTLRKHDRRLERLGLLKVHRSIGDNDNDIPHLNTAGGGTIQTNTAASTFTFYNIGLKTLTIIIIQHLHLLTGDEVGSIHQVLVDGDTPHVVKIGLRHGDAMQL